jgi:DNA replication protein DnaC
LLAEFRELIRGSKPWPLLLFGPAGTGKTLASLCLCDITPRATYFTADTLADRVVADREFPEFVKLKQLAVLDEIGTRGVMTGPRADLHYRSIKEFADARTGKATIYITNLSPKGKDGNPSPLVTLYDDRLFSRIACGTWFELKGEDRRMA